MAKKSHSNKTAMPAAPSMPKRVSIEKAANGFVIEKFNNMGPNKIMIAKNHAEAMKVAKKLLK